MTLQALPANPYIEGAGGWWTPPRGGIANTTGYKWAQGQYSPQFLGGIQDMYGLLKSNLGEAPDIAGTWQQYQPGSLAAGYREFLEGSPELEQMQYNRALSRLKGQTGTARQMLDRSAGARRGGAGYGGYTAGLTDINRELMRGTGEIATAQAMQSIADRERRQKELLGYEQQDITNQMGWLGGLTGGMNQDWQNRQGALNMYGGWMGSMIPYEQWNIQTPRNWANQSANLSLRKAQMQEQINANRRAESMGWLNNLMGWQNQLANQYYTGQGQWGGYQGQRGGNILSGYDPGWYSWTGM